MVLPMVVASEMVAFGGEGRHWKLVAYVAKAALLEAVVGLLLWK